MSTQHIAASLSKRVKSTKKMAVNPSGRRCGIQNTIPNVTTTLAKKNARAAPERTMGKLDGMFFALPRGRVHYVWRAAAADVT
jgi:hypothetical protein